MSNQAYTPRDLRVILARAHDRFDNYRKQPNLDRRGNAREKLSFDEAPPRKSRAQLEREIVGKEIRLSHLKVRSPKQLNAGREAKKLEPRFSTPTARDIRITNAAGATSINFRVDSLSKTSKRHTASEAWHSASHAKYIEREEALPQHELGIGPVAASNYIERPDAVATADDECRAIYSNISDDPEERQRFWKLVEEHEPDGYSNELMINMAVAGPITLAVADDPECPPQLVKMINDASPTSTIVFAEGDNVMLRSVFERHGWAKPPRGERRKKDEMGPSHSSGKPTDQGIRFKDSRAGRTQIQANGELPAEVSLAGKKRIARAMRDWFDRRSLPVTVVVHAPDHKNNEKNWHFHFAAYDRPCRRFRNTIKWLGQLPADATAKQKKDHEKAVTFIGRSELNAYKDEWDFAVPVEVKTASRNRRTTYPFQQNKDRFVNSDDFIPALRELLVQLCNDELEREGYPPRYDSRNYPEMGINKEPGEHLDKAAAQLEKMGVPTQKGCENEERQWAYLTHKVAHEYGRSIETIDAVYSRQVEQIERDIDQSKHMEAKTRWEEWRSLTAAALLHLRVQRELELLLERAMSRAKKTATACKSLLVAVDAGKASKAEVSSRALYDKRLRLAEDHLFGVEIHFKEQVEQIEDLKRRRSGIMLAASDLVGPRGAAMSTKGEPSEQHRESTTLGDVAASLAAKPPALCENLLRKFSAAETDDERSKAAVLIRADPLALKEMEGSGNAEWQAEQKRFATQQRLSKQSGLIKTDVMGRESVRPGAVPTAATNGTPLPVRGPVPAPTKVVDPAAEAAKAAAVLAKFR